MTDTTLQEKLRAALDLDALPAEEREKTLFELNEIVVRGSLVRLMERMDEPTKADFAKLMESEPNENALASFLSARVPGASAAVEETIASLTDDILAASQS